MQRREYSAAAVKFSFWFLEFKKTITLIHEGFSVEEIRQRNSEENLFSARSEARAKMILSTVLARLHAMPDSFINEFLSADIASQKLYCLTACLCYDTLFFEFVYEVVREKLLLGVDSFTDSDVRLFFAEKQRQSEKVAAWTDISLNRLARSYKTMLYEAGMIDKGKTERKILRPIIFPTMEKWLLENDLEMVLKALQGVA